MSSNLWGLKINCVLILIITLSPRILPTCYFSAILTLALLYQLNDSLQVVSEK